MLRLEKTVLLRYFGSFLSSGLHPKQPHILQPVRGSLVFRTSSGTWQRHDLFDFEKAFMHFRQHPFLASKFSSFSFIFFEYFSYGLNSGSSPRLMKSSLEQPLQPQVWQPFCPIAALLWERGTTHTHAFLFLSVCLQILQHWLRKGGTYL